MSTAPRKKTNLTGSNKIVNNLGIVFLDYNNQSPAFESAKIMYAQLYVTPKVK
jgi:hypothetical protein